MGDHDHSYQTDVRATSLQALDAHGIDAFCDDILDGLSYRAIAEKLGIAKSSVFRWIAADPDRSARARAALEESAKTEEEKAEDVLTGADGNKHDWQIRRELSQLHRWKARVRNPRQYGDKVEVNQTAQVTVLADAEVVAQLAATQAAIRKLQGEREEGAGDAGS